MRSLRPGHDRVSSLKKHETGIRGLNAPDQGVPLAQHLMEVRRRRPAVAGEMMAPVVEALCGWV